MFELYDLQRLLEVQKKGTFSAAAEALHISQPSLSRSMQKLEKEFGCSMFTRTKNSVKLNESGKLAAEEAKAVLSAARRMSERMQAHAQSFHRISIGSCAPGPLWICEKELGEAHPELELHGELTSDASLSEGLYNDRYQLAISSAPLKESGIISKKLLTEQLLVSLPPSHPLAKRDCVSLHDLNGQTMLLFSDLGIWQRLVEEKMQGIHFVVQNSREAFADLIRLSFLPCFDTNLSEGYAAMPMDRVRIPISDPDAAITFYVSSLKKNRRLLEAPLNDLLVQSFSAAPHG